MTLCYRLLVENKQEIELTICGRKAVMAVLQNRITQVERLFFNKDLAPDLGRTCANLAEQRKIYRMVDDKELERISESVHHQGIAAAIRVPMPAYLQKNDVEKWSSENRTVLILDAVANNHNLGTMVRTAAYLGIKDILICGREDKSNNPITSSLFRTAEGGLEHVTLWRHADAAEFLKAYPFGGTPSVLGIAADQYSRDELRQLQGRIALLPGADSSTGRVQGSAIALVMGNEEYGLSKAVKAACILSARIDGAGLVESLNVAQAAAVFMYYFAPAQGAQAARRGPSVRSQQVHAATVKEGRESRQRSGPGRGQQSDRPSRGPRSDSSRTKPGSRSGSGSGSGKLHTIRLKKKSDGPGSTEKK